MKKDINQLIRNVKKVVDRHQIAPGVYARWTLNDGTDRDMGVNEYGCADAANILYTINEFPRDIAERQAWIDTLQGMQHADSGLFKEATHPDFHVTAHCLGSLELFDAGALHRIAAFDKYRTKEGLYDFLEALDWEDHPWQASHDGAGLFAAMNTSGEATTEWNNWFLEWLWNEVDPETGLLRKGQIKSLYQSFGGSFHYLFNLEHLRMPYRYPEQMIDSCLKLYYEKMMNSARVTFGRRISFVEADWVYCISRCLRQCNHRFDECVAAVTEFADGYLDYLMSLDPDTDLDMDDLHSLLGALCCVADLQRFLPGKVLADKPLRLVLDRRPFI